MLRVHDRGVAGANVEERCVERLDIFERGPKVHVLWIAGEVCGDASRDRLVRRPHLERGPAAAHQLPEVANRACTGESAGHAHDCDVVRVISSRHTSLASSDCQVSASFAGIRRDRYAVEYTRRELSGG